MKLSTQSACLDMEVKAVNVLVIFVLISGRNSRKERLWIKVYEQQCTRDKSDIVEKLQFPYNYSNHLSPL